MTRELEGKIMDNEDLVREYSNNLTTYEQFTNLMETYICNLLNREQISFHSITSRTKSIESLSKKIELKNKYQKLDEITDLSGIRVITYYTDTVDQISKLIENEFIIILLIKERVWIQNVLGIVRCIMWFKLILSMLKHRNILSIII